MPRQPKPRVRSAAHSVRQCYDAPLAGCSVGYCARVSLETGAVAAWHAVCCEFAASARAQDSASVSPVSLGGWAMLHACIEGRYWPDRAISVDVSRRQLVSGVVLEQVDAALAESGLDPQRLEIVLSDVTPGSLERALLHTIWALRDRGVGLMLSDTGCDGNGLMFLRRVPATAIALPARAVMAASRHAADAECLRALVSAARTLDLAIVAGGVDTEEQRVMAKLLGCGQAEGLLFAGMTPASAAPVCEAIETCGADGSPSELRHECLATTH